MTQPIIIFVMCSFSISKDHAKPNIRNWGYCNEYEYEVSIELNVTSVETVDNLRTLIHNLSFYLPLSLDSNVNLTHIEITTAFPQHYEYIISIELNATDMREINLLRNILRNTSYPIEMNRYSNISDINITTVCSPSSHGYQCRCEEGYRWPCDKCFFHGSCDNITNDTCGCINSIPFSGEYCQNVDQYDFIPCPPSTTTPATIPPPTFDHEYLISIELTTKDMSVITLLRNILLNVTFPIFLSGNAKIFDISLTTVCSANNGVYQCRCEDHHHWTCDQCLKYGSCDENIRNDSCGCVNTIPSGGMYCQSVHQLNTTCPLTTTPTTQHTTPTSSTPGANNTIPPTTVRDSTLVSTSSTTPSLTTGVTIIRTSLSPTTEANTTITQTSTQATSTIPTTPTLTDLLASALVFHLISLSTVKKLQMAIKLAIDYTAELSEQTSPAYIELKSRISPVLRNTYQGLTGFVGVDVTGFRPGSVITDFILRTSQVDNEELSVANKRVTEAMQPIAPVIGGVTVYYRSTTEIAFPPVTFTGRSMRLTCGPPPDSINLGTITSAKWKLGGKEIKNSGRTQITLSEKRSVLTVNNVILADTGLYECNLMGSLVTFVQVGLATRIKQAPNVRVPSKINVRCLNGETQPLECCVQSDYTVKWFQDTVLLNSENQESGDNYCILHRYVLSGCGDSPTQELRFTCRVDNPIDFEARTTMIIFNDDATCKDTLYGNGRPGDISSIACDPGQEGSKTAICKDTGEWSLLEDNCIVTEIKDLLIVSEDLVEEEVPEFAANLSKVTQDEKQNIVDSSATISAIVGLLNAIANVSTEVTQTVMEDVLQTVDILISDDARESWEVLRENVTRNDSSALLNSIETISNELVGDFNISTGLILLNRIAFNDSFLAELNSSVIIEIPETNSTNLFITTVIFSTLDNVLPPRNSTFNDGSLTNTSASFINTINAAIALVSIDINIQNISLSFKKDNNSLTQSPQCVFWNFSLFDNFGAWDDEGCKLVSDVNNTVTCNCNHLTSFSILMATNIPESIRVALDIITYIGVGISIASLLVCLIIEGYVWKALTRNSTAFMRHLCIVNSALSLIIADICFIIAASYAKNPLENPGEEHRTPLGPCTTATFFMHFFYLALFFWMLVSGLLLFYRTVMVFSQTSKSVMVAIAFVLGYVCPLIIAVVTVAATAPQKGYIRENDACWLNWLKTKALLALVIPALIIVAINILIVIVVMFKMLKRGARDAVPTDEKSTLAVILRCVIILTPFFGLTWALGVGTMVSSQNKGIHIAFAFFNSLQGFFILVFGTLLDQRIRAILSKKRQVSSSWSGSKQTASTSRGISSLSGLKWLRQFRGKKDVYRVSEAVNSSSTGGAESFSNI
ncbi:adhesion G protein-coupled receptor F5-like [Stigmatopora argus]